MNSIKYNAFCHNQVSFSGTSKPVEKTVQTMVKDLNFNEIYGAQELGNLKIKDKLYTVFTAGNGDYFSIRDGKTLGFIGMYDRMYNGKTCYSVAELFNESGPNGTGTKLMQLGFKSHKDSGKTGEFRAHDVREDAEEFYEKLGFIEDTKREGQWYLPKENEHILENYNGGL